MSMASIYGHTYAASQQLHGVYTTSHNINLLQLSLISVNPCMLHADEKYWVAFTKLFGGSTLIIIIGAPLTYRSIIL